MSSFSIDNLEYRVIGPGIESGYAYVAWRTEEGFRQPALEPGETRTVLMSCGLERQRVDDFSWQLELEALTVR